MDALYERADCLRRRFGPLVAEAQALELALIAALPETAARSHGRDLAEYARLTAHRAGTLADELDRECQGQEERLSAAINEMVAEVSLTPLVAHCTAFDDEAMRSGSIQRRNDAAGARAAAVVIETYKRLPDELKPVYCSPQTLDQHRAGLVRRGIDVKALEAEG